MNIKEQLQSLANKYPNLKIVRISYNGSGDNFDDFYDIEVTEGTYKDNDLDNFMTDAADLLNYALDNSEADFNNDGSRGIITFNFNRMVLSIDNYWNEMIEHASGIITFPQNEDDIEGEEIDFTAEQLAALND